MSLRNKVVDELSESAQVKIKTALNLSEQIIEAAKVISSAYKQGGKVLIAGNGGSAADAQHIVGELVGRFKKERKPLAALALNTNTSVLTAIANDYGYDLLFARQLEAMAGPDDVFVGISTSGNSANVLKAAELAKTKGLKIVSLLGGSGGKIKDVSNVSLVVPSSNTQRIQETHITIAHIICDLVEEELFGDVV